MLRVEMVDAKPGMPLAMPVRNPRPPYQVLLKSSYRLEGGAIARLREMGVRCIWVQYPGFEFLDNYLSPELVQAQGEVLDQITKTFEVSQRQSVAKLPLAAYTRTVGEMINQLIANPQAAIFLGDLIGSNDSPHADLMRHSSATTHLSLLMGLKLEGYLVKQRKHMDPVRAKEVTNLGIGAMLHDLGITQLPAEVVTRYHETADDSDPAWQEHPALGYHMVRGSVEPSAATVVLNHHQRFNGSGYAGGGFPKLEGQRIHIYPRIVAMAEQFDRMRSPTRGRAIPTVKVLRMLLSTEWACRFDPQVLRALITVAPPFPPGSIIRLSDGRSGVAVDHHPQDPCRPSVQIMMDELPAVGSDGQAEIIDLSCEHPELHVAWADNTDISEWLFPKPKIMSDELAMVNWW